MTDDFTSGGGLWLFAILALMWGGGFGAFGGYGNAGFANAIGYQNLATQNDVQRGFDNQNSMANQREILNAVTNGTALDLQLTDTTNIGDKEIFNLVVYRAISPAVTGDPLPITTTINGVAGVPIKNFKENE